MSLDRREVKIHVNCDAVIVCSFKNKDKNSRSVPCTSTITVSMSLSDSSVRTLLVVYRLAWVIVWKRRMPTLDRALVN